MLHQINLTEYSDILDMLNVNSLDPRDHNVSNETIFLWRRYLRERLLEQRHYKSDYSGKRLHQVHMHEGILSRANVPKSIWWHFYIFHPFNSFLLSPEEHIPQPPTRQWAIQKAYTKYGRPAVRDWYYSLPFKVRPFELQ